MYFICLRRCDCIIFCLKLFNAGAVQTLNVHCFKKISRTVNGAIYFFITQNRGARGTRLKCFLSFGYTGVYKMSFLSPFSSIKKAEFLQEYTMYDLTWDNSFGQMTQCFLRLIPPPPSSFLLTLVRNAFPKGCGI